MRAKLYSLSLSHPSHAVRAMLVAKGIEHEVTDLPLGSQPVLLRALGFRGRTVPALKIDGRKVQGSLRISRALEALRPDPPLFPADRRAAVEEAEEWGERELQPMPRRFLRWGAANRAELLRFLVEHEGIPAPGLVARASKPQVRYFAYVSRASDESVREGLAELPAKLDRVDALIAAGTIGVPGEPTAADFQIASTITALRGLPELEEMLRGRPATELAERLFPEPPARYPRFLPEEWIPPLRG